jgi:hypothetical protein
VELAGSIGNTTVTGPAIRCGAGGRGGRYRAGPPGRLRASCLETTVCDGRDLSDDEACDGNCGNATDGIESLFTDG